MMELSPQQNTESPKTPKVTAESISSRLNEIDKEMEALRIAKQRRRQGEDYEARINSLLSEMEDLYTQADEMGVSVAGNSLQ